MFSGYENHSDDELWNAYHNISDDIDELYNKSYPDYLPGEYYDSDQAKIAELEEEAEAIETEAAKRGLVLYWMKRDK